jgi:hypothetical protein
VCAGDGGQEDVLDLLEGLPVGGPRKAAISATLMGRTKGRRRSPIPLWCWRCHKPTTFVAWLADTPSGFPVTAGSSLLSGNAYRS